MAKRNEEGPGTFMILVLVFFVLATIILGVTTYMGYKGQEELENSAKASADKQKAAEAQATEQLMRRNVDRFALGVETPENRQELAGAGTAHAATILDEYKLIRDKLGAAAVLPGGKGDFDWPMGADGTPAAAPKKNVPQIAKDWERIAKDAEARFQAEKRAREAAQLAAQTAQANRDKDKEAFDNSVKALNEQMKAKIDAMDKAFVALKTEADKAGLNFKKIEDQWAEEKTRLEEQVSNRVADLRAAKEKVTRLENADPSDIEVRWKNLNVGKIAERMGTVLAKNGEFVNLEFTQPLVLIPGQTFVVIPANRSLVEVVEREKALEKHHYEVVSSNRRDPFLDNEMIKGMVEITKVTSRYSAEARITYQNQDIRNPIAKGDQVFNMTLSSGEKEHVAFAGIIDLDGDGRPDTEAFIKLLETNNLIVDAYLDLKTGEVRGKGMNTGTRFLILGTEAPEIGKIKTMVKQAKTNGSQLIDARMFMSLIGIKPPRGAAPPSYASVNLGTADEAPAAKEGEPMAPGAEPKK